MSKEAQIENILLDEVLKGKLKKGDLLEPERDLAEKYNCSRPVVHRAIIRLEEKGVLKIRPRKGIQVLDYKMHGRMGLISEVSKRSKDLLDNKFNKDMLRFIQDNMTNMFMYFENGKEETCIQFECAEDYFDILLDYSIQTGNDLYIMLMNEFRPGIINVGAYCIGHDDINKEFQQIESYLMKGCVTEAIDTLNILFGLIEKVWLGGKRV
ncbi:winged helix-turn-helix domain-containing protein [Acidaminobacter sp. JC074]|uniref:winged helix-turn-helix domain-containing protein n=1 Tax=Acidaminobacter sp. JC074 TaxID=2530199 RepID=UPI001F0D7EF5|nr:winged helix-turn-helix domain-containing protein [Acidaminobacter sp. JC074]